MPVDTKGMKIL